MGRPALHTEDLTGCRFHWLKVLEGTDQGVAGNRLWLCECACGRKKLVKRKNLISGTTRSCGCLQRKVSSSRLGGSTWGLMPGAEAI